MADEVDETLPDSLVGSLPSVEDLEAELALEGGTDTDDEPWHPGHRAGSSEWFTPEAFGPRPPFTPGRPPARFSACALPSPR